MKRITLCLVALAVSFGSIASPVTRDVSRRAAVNFWNSHHPADVKPVDAGQLQLMPVAELPMLHIWSVDQTGFVIMAASDLATPVLAYSFNSDATREPNPEVMFWLRQYNGQIAAAEAAGLSSVTAADQWNDLQNDPVPPTPVSLVVVPQLMHTTWDQDNPYNTMCPYDSVRHERAVVGCVATAMAQIMKYWNHPSSGVGYHSYIHQGWNSSSSYGLQEADFEHTTYMWEYMPNAVSILGAVQRAVDAVSTISYHCGVAVDMMYGVSSTGGSGAYSSCGYWAEACAENAFRDYFKYSRDLHHETRNTVVWRDSTAIDSVTLQEYNVHYRADSALIPDEIWTAMIDSNLAHNAPIYYSGSDTSGGHAFVLDGSDAQGRYHFNWGWSGHYNGYYGINDVAPRAGGTGGNATYTFNSNQGAIFGIFPLEEVFYDGGIVYDTVCRNSSEYHFHDYVFPAADSVYTAVYLDTVYTINLTVINTRRAFFSSNGGSGNPYERQYCPADGLEMPNCSYTRENCLFLGWGRDSHDNDTLYQPGDVVRVRSNVTFYAIWNDTTVIPEPQAVVTLSDDDNTIIISPNPTRDDISLSLVTDEEVTVTVIDQWGRVVVQRTVIGGKAKISLSHLTAGTYTMTVHTLDAVYKKRIIKL